MGVYNELFELTVNVSGTLCGQPTGYADLIITPGGTAPFKYEIDGTFVYSNDYKKFEFKSKKNVNEESEFTNANNNNSATKPSVIEKIVKKTIKKNVDAMF